MFLFSLLNIKKMAGAYQEDTDFFSVVLSNWLSIFFFAHCFIVPIAVITYFCRNREKLQDVDFLGKVGTFIEGANKGKKTNLIFAIMVQVSFFLRSVTLSISVV